MKPLGEVSGGILPGVTIATLSVHLAIGNEVKIKALPTHNVVMPQLELIEMPTLSSKRNLIV